MNTSAVYCFKNKEHRKNLEMYKKLAMLIERQSYESGEVYVDNMAIATKSIRFGNEDGVAFKTAIGDYFLWCSGKNYDMVNLKLECVARDEEELKFTKMVAIGYPEDNYYGEDEDEESPPSIASFKDLDIELPVYEDEKHSLDESGDDYILVQQIVSGNIKSCQRVYISEFTGDDEIKNGIAEMLQCATEKDSKKFEGRCIWLEKLVKNIYLPQKNLQTGSKFIVSGIDGSNNHLRNCFFQYWHSSDESCCGKLGYFNADFIIDDFGLFVSRNLQFADKHYWNKIKSYEMVELLSTQPQFADKCDWSKLHGWNWVYLLSAQPQFADKCNWSKLGGSKWSRLLSEQPQFADKCVWYKLNGKNWVELLNAQSQFANKCFWHKLSDDDWELLLAKHPQFADKRNR